MPACARCSVSPRNADAPAGWVLPVGAHYPDCATFRADHRAFIAAHPVTGPAFDSTAWNGPDFN